MAVVVPYIMTWVLKKVTESCEFKYMYDAEVAPTILDGGKELLLANFHGPRSLKCDTKDGGLAMPTPKHTYAGSKQRISV